MTPLHSSHQKIPGNRAPGTAPNPFPLWALLLSFLLFFLVTGSIIWFVTVGWEKITHTRGTEVESSSSKEDQPGIPVAVETHDQSKEAGFTELRPAPPVDSPGETEFASGTDEPVEVQDISVVQPLQEPVLQQTDRMPAEPSEAPSIPEEAEQQMESGQSQSPEDLSESSSLPNTNSPVSTLPESEVQAGHKQMESDPLAERKSGSPVSRASQGELSPLSGGHPTSGTDGESVPFDTPEENDTGTLDASAVQQVDRGPPGISADMADKTTENSTETEEGLQQESVSGDNAAPSLLLIDPHWLPLITRLEADGFDKAAMEDIFARLGPESYSPAYMGLKITELYGPAGIGINRSKVPPPELPETYMQPVSEVTVGSCLDFIKEQGDVFTDIQQRHGVGAPTILSILLVETAMGRDLGNDVALRALASMAATNTPEKLASKGNHGQKQRVRASSLSATLKDKSEWAYGEVKALIRYAWQKQRDPCLIPGSIYGAIGICQFMPSNIELFGVDGDNDGSIDVFSVVDAMYSVAKYLESNGWRESATDKAKHAVIRTYNHDDSYAATVLATSKNLDRALLGKVSRKNSPVVAIGSIGRVPSARLDPSLRRFRSVPPRARVKSLGSYGELLQ